jgi:hypothetical protein
MQVCEISIYPTGRGNEGEFVGVRVPPNLEG